VRLKGSPVWLSSVHWLEGAANGRPQGAQQPAWRRLVASCPHSEGDGDAVPGMVLGMVGMAIQD
jgi:hypothetical protein